MECRFTTNGHEALTIAASFRPTVAVLDIGLPQMDGYQLARRLRAAQPDAKIIALSGYGQKADKAAASAAGFDRHLTKPVDVDKLVQTLRDVLALQD